MWRFELALEIYEASEEAYMAGDVYRAFIGRCCAMRDLPRLVTVQKQCAALEWSRCSAGERVTTVF